MSEQNERTASTNESTATDERQPTTGAAAGTEAAPAEPAPADAADELKQKIIEVLKTCYDPEIPVNIYELGLVYKIDVDPEGNVSVEMTLTSPMCPVAGSLPPEVENKIRAIEGVRSVKVDVVWDPPWTPEKMTEAARLQLGMF